MSADIGLFHSSEVDDQSLLAIGWYIGIFTGEDLTTDGAIGPYETQADAAKALSSGEWLDFAPTKTQNEN
jgi:hypothetical protein